MLGHQEEPYQSHLSLETYATAHNLTHTWAYSHLLKSFQSYYSGNGVSFDMDHLENNMHSFVIKLWLEERADKFGRTLWRGRITHVASGEQRFIEDLNEIPPFIKPYLAEIHMKQEKESRDRCWLKRIFG